MPIFDWRYRVEEIDEGGRLIDTIVQAQDVRAAAAGYEALVAAKPMSHFIWLEGMRIMDTTLKRSAPTRTDPEDYRSGIEAVCGRYAVLGPAGALRRQFGTTTPLINVPVRYNAAPGHALPVIRYNRKDGCRSLDLLTWGLVEGNMPMAVNVRAEGAAKKFPSALMRRRCLVPADAIFAWQSGAGKIRQPFAIALRNRITMAMAGLWTARRRENGSLDRSFAILTTSANDVFKSLTDRMPVLVPPPAWTDWLGDGSAAGLPLSDLVALLCPYPAGEMEIWPIGPDVDSVKNNYQQVLARLPAGTSVM
jgi:putative SOS response-associated peptidase YedK